MNWKPEEKKDQAVICQNIQSSLSSSGYPSIGYVCRLYNGFYWMVILAWK